MLKLLGENDDLGVFSVSGCRRKCLLCQSDNGKSAEGLGNNDSAGVALVFGYGAGDTQLLVLEIRG